jgi:threonine dehydratase
MVERPNTTTAEGVATGTAFELPQRIMRELLTDFVVVDDRDLLVATRLMIEKTRTLVEPAGAAPLAAALDPALAPQLRGRRVALICSGANISPAQLAEVMSPAAPARSDA